MTEQHVNGEESLALGAQDENIDIATGYPGSPGGGIISLLMAMSLDGAIVNWSANEKIAIEKGIGAAINDRKALVCVKSVGLNAMLDPLTVVNITPLTGALVIIVGDDPGAYGSQNDQDSRNLAPFLQLPWLEPDNPQNGYDLLRLAFEISHNYALPVFLRITRSYALQKQGVIKRNPTLLIPPYNFDEVISPRFVPVPSNAVAKQHELDLRITAYEDDLSGFSVHQQYGENSNSGLIVCGHLIEKLLQVADLPELVKHFNLLFLHAIFPLPGKVIQEFLSGLKSVLVMEENTPMISQQLKVVAANHHINVEWEEFTHPGEIFRWEISHRIKQEFPGLVVNENYTENYSEKPVLKSNCSSSRYDEVLTILDTCAEKLGKKVNYYGDPGCLVSVNDRLQAKYAMGGSVSTVFGANLADPSILNIAFIGDSGFFHSAIPAIIDAVHHQANIAMILLNNNAALTTGGQLHPGSISGADNGINYRKLLGACGIKNYAKLNLDQSSMDSIKTITDFLQCADPRMLQIDINT
jgi:indolepyruvate ferredoxin oxidoreductase, alpha subunit